MHVKCFPHCIESRKSSMNVNFVMLLLLIVNNFKTRKIIMKEVVILTNPLMLYRIFYFVFWSVPVNDTPIGVNTWGYRLDLQSLI